MKQTKKLLSLLIAMMMLIGLLPIGVSAASAPSVYYWTHTNDPEGWYSFGSISFCPVPGIDVYKITLYKNNQEVYSFTSWWDGYGEDTYVDTETIYEIVKNGSGSYTFTVSSCDEDENVLATTPMSAAVLYTEPATTLATPRLTQNSNGVLSWAEVQNAEDYHFELEFFCDGENFLKWTGTIFGSTFDWEFIEGWEDDIPTGYTKDDVEISFRIKATPLDIREFMPSAYTEWVVVDSGDLGSSASGGSGGGIGGGGTTTKPDTSAYPKYPENLEWGSHGIGTFSFTPAKDTFDYIITLYKEEAPVLEYHFVMDELEPSVNFPWFMNDMTRLGSGEYTFSITTPDEKTVYSSSMDYQLAPTARYLYNPQVQGDTLTWTDYDAEHTDYYIVGFYLNYGDSNYYPIEYLEADEPSLEIGAYDWYLEAIEEKYKEDATKYPKSAAKLIFAPYAIPTDMETYQIGIGDYTEKHSIGKSGTLDAGINWKLDNGTLTLTGSGNTPDFENGAIPWWDYREEITKVVVGSGITGIGKNTFASLPKMTSATLPNTVSELGELAFAYDTSLTSISLSDSITKIGNSAFLGCTGLRAISLPKNLTTLGTYAFSGCTSAFGGVTVPGGITEIPEGVFQSCQNLTGVTLHDKVTKIGNEAFQNTGITEITFPDSLIEIGESALSGTKIASLVIPNSVTELGGYALSFCYDLKDVTLPKNLTTIREGLFMGSNITEITLPDSITTMEKKAFSDSNIAEIVLPPFLTEIPYCAFMSCEKLQRVRMRGNVKTIGESAFDNCEQLRDIVLPHTLKSIGATAFRRCLALTEIQLPNRLKSIGKSAFEGAGLTEICIPDSVTEIDMVAFKGCKSLTKATLSKGMTAVPQGMFKEASALKEIVIPYGYTEIGVEAFCYCTGLKKLTLPITVTTVKYQGVQSISGADIYYGGTETEYAAISGVFSAIRNTLHYGTLAKTETTEVSVSEGKTSVTVENLDAACEEKTVLCGLYLEGVLQEIVHGTYTGEALNLSPTATAYDEVRMMVWNSLSDNTPVSNGETITAIGGPGL